MGSLTGMNKPTPETKKESKPKDSKPETKPVKTPKTTSVQILGKEISINLLKEIAEFVLDSQNYNDLLMLIDHYKRTYMNPKRIRHEGGITENRNDRIVKMNEFLLEINKKIK